MYILSAQRVMQNAKRKCNPLLIKQDFELLFIESFYGIKTAFTKNLDSSGIR